MISLVNGYICKSCTDVAEALQGKKPPAIAGELPYSSGSEGKISAFSEQQVARPDGADQLASAQSSAATSSYVGPQSDGQTSGASLASSSVQTSAGGINLLV